MEPLRNRILALSPDPDAIGGQTNGFKFGLLAAVELLDKEPPIADPEFLKYLKSAKDDFVNAINRRQWNSELRGEAENFVIAFDQLMDKINTL